MNTKIISALSTMLLTASILGGSSAFAESTTVSTTDPVEQVTPSLENPVITLIEPAALPIPQYTQADVSQVTVSSQGDIDILSQSKNVIVTRNYSLNDTIPGSIVYTEDNDTAERSGGTLQRVNIAQHDTYITVTFSGTIYKDVK